MTDPQMPDMDAALHQAQLAQSSLEDFKHGINTGTFTGTDDARTVEVTINGRQWLTDLYIEDGLLRLGAETVGARLNEAVGNAQAAATAGVEAQQEQLLAKLADIAETLQAQVRSLQGNG
jgi:DNA-binding protein YbaB